MKNASLYIDDTSGKALNCKVSETTIEIWATGTESIDHHGGVVIDRELFIEFLRFFVANEGYIIQNVNKYKGDR